MPRSSPPTRCPTAPPCSARWCSVPTASVMVRTIQAYDDAARSPRVQTAGSGWTSTAGRPRFRPQADPHAPGVRPAGDPGRDPSTCPHQVAAARGRCGRASPPVAPAPWTCTCTGCATSSARRTNGTSSRCEGSATAGTPTRSRVARANRAARASRAVPRCAPSASRAAPRPSARGRRGDAGRCLRTASR